MATSKSEATGELSADGVLIEALEKLQETAPHEADPRATTQALIEALLAWFKA